MKKEIYTCDACGTERQTANHWYGVVIAGLVKGVSLWRFKDGEDYDAHICGEACLAKYVSQWARKTA